MDIKLTVSANVQAKGERLVREDKVLLIREDAESIVYFVRGDTGDHTVFINKRNVYADSCSCTWNVFHANTPSCSHRFAARLKMMLVAA